MFFFEWFAHGFDGSSLFAVKSGFFVKVGDSQGKRTKVVRQKFEVCRVCTYLTSIELGDARFDECNLVRNRYLPGSSTAYLATGIYLVLRS